MRIYKIMLRREWKSAVDAGIYRGSADDIRDGFIHFSAADQVAETAAKHFSGQTDLVLIAFNADALGSALKWETSRGGFLFPHLYGDLDPGLALDVTALPSGAERAAVIDSALRA